MLSQSATTRLVTRLEERGLSSRCPGTTDRRGIYMDVTKAGRVLLEDARRTNQRALRKVLGEARNAAHLQLYAGAGAGSALDP